MGGTPKTALNITCWNKSDLELTILGDIVRGGADKVIESGAVLVGGHTVESPELMYGLAVTGLVHPDKFVRNYGAKQGDVLVLTKNLGIGILTTGLKFDKIGDQVLPQLVESMTRLNASASVVMQKYDVSACTDVTGYGLLGHASEMASGNDVRLKINSQDVPYFADAPSLVAQDTYTQAYLANTTFLSDKVSFQSSVSEEMQHILMEAETSGGLLFALPAENADAAVKELQNADCPEAAVIGEVVAADTAHIEVY